MILNPGTKLFDDNTDANDLNTGEQITSINDWPAPGDAPSDQSNDPAKVVGVV